MSILSDHDRADALFLGGSMYAVALELGKAGKHHHASLCAKTGTFLAELAGEVVDAEWLEAKLASYRTDGSPR